MGLSRSESKARSIFFLFLVFLFLVIQRPLKHAQSTNPLETFLVRLRL